MWHIYSGILLRHDDKPATTVCDNVGESHTISKILSGRNQRAPHSPPQSRALYIKFKTRHNQYLVLEIRVAATFVEQDGA